MIVAEKARNDNAIIGIFCFIQILKGQQPTAVAALFCPSGKGCAINGQRSRDLCRGRVGAVHHRRRVTIQVVLDVHLPGQQHRRHRLFQRHRHGACIALPPQPIPPKLGGVQPGVGAADSHEIIGAEAPLREVEPMGQKGSRLQQAPPLDFPQSASRRKMAGVVLHPQAKEHQSDQHKQKSQPQPFWKSFPFSFHKPHLRSGQRAG